MQDRRARRPPRRVHGMRPRGAVLQLVPQSTLPQVPVSRAGTLDRQAPRAAPAGALLPRRLHAAVGAARRRDALARSRLRHVVRERVADPAHACARSETSRRRARRHDGAPHLDARAPLPSARARHRHRRRALGRQRALGACAQRLPLPGARHGRPVPGQDARRARACAHIREHRRRPRRPARALSQVLGRLRQASLRWTRAGRSLPRPLHPTASASPTSASSRWTSAASPSAPRTAGRSP